VARLEHRNRHFDIPWGRSAATVGVAILAAGCGQIGIFEDTAKGTSHRISRAPAPETIRSAEFSEISPYGSYLAGRHADRMRQVGLAADLYTLTLTFDPDNPELLRRTYYLSAIEGRMDEAVSLARRLVVLRPKEPLAGVTLALEDARSGNYRAAQERLEALPRNGFNNFIVPMLLAWTLAGQNKPDAAVAALKPLAERSGLKLLRDYHGALIYDRAGNMKAAAEFYAKAAPGKSASFVRIIEAIGAFHERSGRAAKAKDMYLAYQAAHPDTLLMRSPLARIAAGQRPERMIASVNAGLTEALFNLASLLHQENVHEIALILARMAGHVGPDLPILRLLIADILDSQGRGIEAVAAYDAIQMASPLSWSARLRAASILNSLEKTEAAVSRLRALAAERPDRADPLIALGDILRHKKRFREAIGAYDEALGRVTKVQERHWSLLYARGIALERSKEWARAESDFLRALEFKPLQPYVLNYLGYSWAEQGVQLTRALKMIEEAVKLRPGDGYFVDSMGWVLYRMGKFEGAVVHLERAAELRPHDPTINDHLGDAYWRVGRLKEARFQWRRVLLLNPEPGAIAAIEKKLKYGLKGGRPERKAAEKGTLGQGG
jgi:tetratricopeptide (TPR) repeat protein